MTAKVKPYPRVCGNCRKKAVTATTIPHHETLPHDSREYAVIIPALQVDQCQECGEFTVSEDGQRAISAELRNQAGLLQPEQIRAEREKLKLTQHELADLIGVADATLSRWETGAQLQPRSLDKLLRLTFESSAARLFLDSLDNRSVASPPPPEGSATPLFTTDSV